MVAVRHAEGHEASAVLDVWTQAEAEPTLTDDEPAIRALLDYAPGCLLAAVDGGRMVGTLIVAWDGWRGSFYRLAVVPDRRREGIACQLVQEGERQLVALGARRLALFAATGDPGAVAFWEAVGYHGQLDRQRLVKNMTGAP